jgi:hypothetical protein
MTVNNACPHCGGRWWQSFEDGDLICGHCGYVVDRGQGTDRACAMLMEQEPGQGHGPDCQCRACVAIRWDVMQTLRRRELRAEAGMLSTNE